MEPLRFAVVTTSDKGARGEREDLSGAAIEELLTGLGGRCAGRQVVPDHRPTVADALRKLADGGTVDLVLTTGGTGFTERDLTPEATRDVIEREAPGIAEALRAEGLRKTPHAMLSRGVAGIRGHTLIVNLPGSVKAVREGVGVLASVLPHLVETLRSADGVECGKG